MIPKGVILELSGGTAAGGKICRIFMGGHMLEVVLVSGGDECNLR